MVQGLLLPTGDISGSSEPALGAKKPSITQIMGALADKKNWMLVRNDIETIGDVNLTRLFFQPYILM
ncbi:MAG: hypothetical protein WC586_04625 [Methanoregula sp.]